MGVIYEAGKAGAATAREHLRICNFRDEHLLRTMKGSLEAAGDADGLTSGHLYIMLDGKVHGNAEKLMKGFTDSKGKALPKAKKMLFVSTTEASERATKAKVQGIGNISTTEICYMVTKETLYVPIKRHLHSAGTNASDTLGPFGRPGGKELWLVRHRGKSSFYGGALVLAGGKVEGDMGPTEDPAPTPNDKVPFTYHGFSGAFYEELFHCYTLTSAWHFTCIDPIAAMAAARLRKPYFGLTLTDKHNEALGKEIVNRIFKQCRTQKIHCSKLTCMNS